MAYNPGAGEEPRGDVALAASMLKRMKTGPVVAPASALLRLRTDPAVIRELLEGDPVVATFRDAENVFPSAGGKRRSLRGGGRITDALKKIYDDAGNALMAGRDIADAKVAAVIEKIPTALKTIVGGAALKFGVEHPSLFANIVELARKVTTDRLLTQSGVTWADYQSAILQIAGSAGQFTKDLVSAPTSPGTVIMTALLVMRYRAGGGSVAALLRSDVEVLRTAAQGAVDKVATIALGQYSAFLTAYSAGAASKTLSQLKELGARGKPPRAVTTGAPAAEVGISDELIALVPAVKEQPVLADALQAIVDLPEPSDEKIVARALLQLAQGASEGGQHRRKTRRSTKRRSTRRRALKLLK